jgi:hypothetical protein
MEENHHIPSEVNRPFNGLELRNAVKGVAGISP